ncbi:hypothetical protein EV643_101195 [Kribbella sp. VKM Ac-2527]|uniref:Lipoprotein LpqN n=1 Tax=Kribbella caucasensis TaxID=2512215 RepID=A0A4R6KP25_9ACTN|nr:hypothetical protein [Kribbella sp. VKM Ac-2527]TDO54406.1 hypothetical protein EV643_101195 [Kribbella sp. VKM Ac-2527]
MKTAVLVSGVVLLGLVGGAAGYEAGRLTEAAPTGSGSNDPTLPPDTPTVGHKLKTPKPNTVPGLKAKGMQFQGHTFTVRQRPRPSVRISIDTPEGWDMTTSKSTPGEVKFLDPLRERGVRVESGFPPDLTPEEFRDKLVGGLGDSQPPENDLRILEESSAEIEDENGYPRSVATLIYTYIPNETRRYVIVRWIATEGDKATVEMSITGLPQDADGLGAVLFEATKTVQLKN